MKLEQLGLPGAEPSALSRKQKIERNINKKIVVDEAIKRIEERKQKREAVKSEEIGRPKPKAY